MKLCVPASSVSYLNEPILNLNQRLRLVNASFRDPSRGLGKNDVSPVIRFKYGEICESIPTGYSFSTLITHLGPCEFENTCQRRVVHLKDPAARE